LLRPSIVAAISAESVLAILTIFLLAPLPLFFSFLTSVCHSSLFPIDSCSVCVPGLRIETGGTHR